MRRVWLALPLLLGHGIVVSAGGSAEPDCMKFSETVHPPSSLNDISMKSAQDGWAVGYQTVLGRRTALAEHWTGVRWTTVAIAALRGRPANELADVIDLGLQNTWAIGIYGTGHGDRAFMEHWDGQDWERVTVPNPG